MNLSLAETPHFQSVAHSFKRNQDLYRSRFCRYP